MTVPWQENETCSSDDEHSDWDSASDWDDTDGEAEREREQAIEQVSADNDAEVTDAHCLSESTAVNAIPVMACRGKDNARTIAAYTEELVRSEEEVTSRPVYDNDGTVFKIRLRPSSFEMPTRSPTLKSIYLGAYVAYSTAHMLESW